MPIEIKDIENLEGGSLELNLLNKKVLSSGLYAELALDFFLSLKFNDANNVFIVSDFFDEINIKWTVED